MNLTELHEGVVNGKITINTNNHHCNPIADTIKHDVNHYGKLLKNPKESDSFKEYIKQKLECRVGYNLSDIEIYCFDCGGRYNLVLTSETTIEMVANTKYFKFTKANRESNGTTDIQEYVDACSTLELRKTGKMESVINVPTGNFIIKNFFGTKELHDPKDVKETSINCITGRYDLMQSNAKRGCAYGTMGNMSMDVFINDARDEIIMGEEYVIVDGEEVHCDREGFINLGNICIDMWRWQGADRENLEKVGEELPTVPPEYETQGWAHSEIDYKDNIQVKIPVGNWKVEHFYDFSDCDDGVYSRLTLIK